MDNLYTKEEARIKIMAGVDKVCDAGKLTLGAGGANAILESDLRPGHRVTNDGVSIINAIFLEDPVEQIGANLIKEVASRADKESGDGTTTSLVLAQAILQEGFKLEGISHMEIKRSLDECLPLIEASIDAQKKEITVNEVGQVATISSESEELGALIQEAYQTIGKDGIIELDNSNLTTTHIEYSDGVRLRFAGYFGQYSCTEAGKAVYKNPKILISKEKITSVDQIENIFKNLSNQNINELILYVEDIDMSVASRLALTHLQGGFKTLIIKAPTLWKDWLFEDFALLTGATPIDFSNGKTFKNFTFSDLGTCEKIISTKDETRVIGTQNVDEHIESLNEAGKLDDQQIIRANWLKTKVAVLKLGANSDSELSYKRLKVIDAISASKLALEGGVVAGGGVALAWATSKLPETIGGDLLRVSLKAPQKQIIENAGGEKQPIVQMPLNKAQEYGFNAKTGELVDMFEAGIVDPAIVVKNSLRNALSVASTVLTTSIVVTLPKVEKPPQNQMYG